MQIWMDGDACPKVIKEILFRAAIRTKTHLIVVSNHSLITPPSLFIRKHQVGFGFDVADNYILDNLAPGDLVITADITLADGVVTKGGIALNPSGMMYTANNIKEHLAFRNMNESLRSSQLISGGPAKRSSKETRDFANALDKWIVQKNAY